MMHPMDSGIQGSLICEGKGQVHPASDVKELHDETAARCLEFGWESAARADAYASG